MNFVLTSALEFLGPFDGQSGRRFGVSAISKGRKYGLQINKQVTSQSRIYMKIFSAQMKYLSFLQTSHTYCNFYAYYFMRVDAVCQSMSIF